MAGAVGGVWRIGLLIVLALGGCSSAGRPAAGVHSGVVSQPRMDPQLGIVSPPLGKHREALQPSAEVRPRVRPFLSPSDILQTGLASWYGPGFHGRRTANGEVYNQHALTAAHKTLPFGSRIRVTNLETDQSIEVRINDRGPFVEERIIDLSYAAARQIGVYEPGTAPVQLEVVTAAAPVLAVFYAVQVGSYASITHAERMKARVVRYFAKAYIRSVTRRGRRLYQVRLGAFRRRADAKVLAREIRQAGLSALVVEEDYRWVGR